MSHEVCTISPSRKRGTGESPHYTSAAPYSERQYLERVKRRLPNPRPVRSVAEPNQMSQQNCQMDYQMDHATCVAQQNSAASAASAVSAAPQNVSGMHHNHSADAPCTCHFGCMDEDDEYEEYDEYDFNDVESFPNGCVPFYNSGN